MSRTIEMYGWLSDWIRKVGNKRAKSSIFGVAHEYNSKRLKPPLHGTTVERIVKRVLKRL